MKLTILASALAASLFMSLNAFATLPTETAEAQALRNGTTVRASYRYCTAGTLTCREVFLLNDKTTGAAVASWYDTFVSAERAVGASSYFMQNANGTFHMYVDDVLDGQVGITKMFPENAALNLAFDANGLPTINHAHAIRVGTTRWLDITTTYTVDKCTMIGTEYDSADPSFSAPVSIEYLRTN